MHPELQIFGTSEKISNPIWQIEQKRKIVNKIYFGALAIQPQILDTEKDISCFLKDLEFRAEVLEPQNTFR